jgi:hypothetical protein
MAVEKAFALKNVSAAAAAIPVGQPGECHYCGEDFTRVVMVVDPKTEDAVHSCGRCRDKRGL